MKTDNGILCRACEGLKSFDDLEEPDEDSYESQDKLLERMENNYELKFELDAAAKDYNSKCRENYLDDALHQEWLVNGKPVDVWCNPPHSKTKEFVKKAFEQWDRYNINIMMIIPANSICTKYADKYIIDSAEYHPIIGRPRFLRDGELSEYPSRNSYFVVIWRKRLNNTE